MRKAVMRYGNLVLGVLVGWLRVACWADARGNPHQPFRRETTHSSVPLSFTSPRPPKHPHVPVPAKSLSTLPTPTGHGQNPETEHRKPCEPRPADATALSCEISWRMSSATAAAIKREAATKAELDELQARSGATCRKAVTSETSLRCGCRLRHCNALNTQSWRSIEFALRRATSMPCICLVALKPWRQRLDHKCEVAAQWRRRARVRVHDCAAREGSSTMCEAERQAEAVVRGCANPSSPGVVLFAPFSDGGYLSSSEEDRLWRAAAAQAPAQTAASLGRVVSSRATAAGFYRERAAAVERRRRQRRRQSGCIGQ